MGNEVSQNEELPNEMFMCMATRSLSPPPSVVYGGNMTILGDQVQWSKPRGSRNNMEYLEAVSVIDLDVKGSISLRLLRPRTSYKCVLELGLHRTWDCINRVTIEVLIPGGPTLSKTYSVQDGRSLWTTDSFTTPSNSTGLLTFRIFSKSTSDKRGITLKRFVVKPV